LSTDRPNIVFILSDQHASNVLGCYGDDIVQTPNLDRLAAEGVVFENTYTPSPICVPARMSLLTGRYPYRQSCWTNSDALNSDIPTTAHALGAVGYHPTLIGRMHAIGPDQLHGYARREIGDHITDWYGGFAYSLGVLDKAQRPFKESLVKSGPGQMSYELVDREVTKNSLAYLDEIAEKRKNGNNAPFSLNVGYMLPHQPYVADPEIYKLYEGKVPPPKLSRPEEEGDDTYLAWWRAQTGLNEVSEEDEIRARTAYYALVDTMDREIGKVLDKLEELDLLENTLIIYSSDHGDQLGERDLWWKQTFYDESAKVPLIMKWAGELKSGERRDQIANLVDVSATLVDAGGHAPLPGIDGKSLLPVARDGDAEWSDTTYSEYCTDGLLAWSGGRVLQSRMIRQGQWKFNYYHGCPSQLFDLKNDPNEMRNLADDSNHQEIKNKLEAQLLAGWNPEAIDEYIQARNKEKAVLKAWAQSVKPADTFRWETKMEDNWLAFDSNKPFNGDK
jgi:choline-sulfatase